ncbi:D-alanyl-D-alanine carboxypeptidase/D-alanyl-D-alanine-endopeptidase [Myxococcota bacterium]|nr:D-alanyl-D-alanine carboxypeptidase/D-alanyl-D-alanine-endopeptidase [Myxococcota bacterium]
MRASLLALCLLLPALAQARPAKHAARDALAAEIDAALHKSGLGGAKIGIVLAPAEGGEPYYQRHPDRLLHPASNAKLITTAAALSLLGPSYTFSTDLAAGEIEAGVADHLYLIGRGDPKFVSESLWKLVDEAREGGLKRVKGDLIIDESFFGPKHLAPGFEEKPNDDAAYRAATGAVSFNFNSIVLRIKPGAAVGDPPVVRLGDGAQHIELINRAETSAKGKERLAVTAKAHQDRTRITVEGAIPLAHRGIVVRRRVDNPPMFTGRAAKVMLAQAGITLEGQVRVGAAPQRRVLLAKTRSPALGALVMDVNKLSNNFMAEHLLRAVGRIKRQRGDWEAGRAEVRQFLKDVVGLKGEFRYANGSGLFGDTAFSARQVVQLLQHMHARRPALPEFAASLAISARDGTLWRRFKPLKDRVRAKTGTLAGVICLSGYLELDGGEVAAFSILTNGVEGGAVKAWRLQDSVLNALARFKSSARP